METPREIDDDAPVPAKLRFAIAHKRLLGLEYNARLRVVEPHDFGAMNGTSGLFVYQLLVDGAAGGGRAQGWRLLDVGKIGACKVLEQTEWRRGFTAVPMNVELRHLKESKLVGEGVLLVGEAIPGGLGLRGASPLLLRYVSGQEGRAITLTSMRMVRA